MASNSKEKGGLTDQLLILQECISQNIKEIILQDHTVLIQNSLHILKSSSMGTTPIYMTSSDIFSLYELYVRKSLLLSLMELFCKSLEMRELSLMYKILHSIRNHNQTVSIATRGMAFNKLIITFADLSDIYVSSRGCVLSHRILAKKPLPLKSLVEWVGFESQITQSFIGLITGTTSLIFDEENYKLFTAKSWQECSRLVASELSPLAELISGRVWQCVGHMICSYFNGLPDYHCNSEVFHEIAKYSGEELSCNVKRCFWYIAISLDANAENNKTYNAFEDNLHLLLSYSCTTHSTTIKTITSPLLLSPSHLMTTPTSLSQVVDTKLAVAMETDRLRLLLPILLINNSRVWSCSNWLVTSLRYHLISNRLSNVISILFEKGPNFLKVVDGLISGWSQVGMSYSSEKSLVLGVWADHWNTFGCKEILHCLQWTEGELSNLCKVFFDQWRDKCELILQTHFPSNWRQPKGDSESHTYYVSIIKDQLLEPLIEGCNSLREETSQHYLIQLSLSILLYELRTLLLWKGKYKMSPQGVAQLKLDYNKLIDYITDPSNGLRPSTHTLINNLGACQDIEKGLEILSSRETEVGGASEEGGVKLMGCQDVYLLKVCKRLDILEKIAWLDYNEWKRIL